uniref:Uncharacterized protein n=1 Tax=Globodera rostochiensis TaxID=31243 RepID=A0A914HH83_GLORO
MFVNNKRLEDYGRRVSDDYVKLVNQNSSAQRYVFLFEKMMMFCKRKDGVYRKKEHILIDDFELVDNELESNHTAPKYNHTLTRKLTNSFFDNTSLTLKRRDAGVHRTAAATQPVLEAVQQPQTQQQQQATLTQLNSLQLVFKTVKQRDEWKELLRKTIDACSPRAAHAKGHTLTYKTYTSVVSCAICKLLLRGKFFQGYHCSGCNRDMHRECACMKECVLLAQQQNGNCRPSSSLNGTYQRHNKRAKTNTQNFFPGETVVARHSSSSSINGTGTSSTRLSYQNGDLIELLELNMADGTAIGRLKQQPQMVGTVALEAMTKMASTLEERAHSRHSRASNHSVSEVIPFQSAYKSSRIVVAPTVEQLPKIMPPPPAPQLSFVSSIIIKDHEQNPNVAEQPWYFGVMGRGESNRLLDGTPGGTFIVRWSVEQQQYALSISVQGTVKHLKAEYDAQTKKYYLHEDRFFDTMIDLINYHRINNLNEAFNIDVVLKGTPLKGTLYRAIAPFQGPEGKDHYITLRTGDLVTLLDTSMDNNGWWKGSINCCTSGGGAARVGYFPATYVKLVSEHATVQQQQQQPPPSTTPPLQTNNNNNNTNVYQNGFGVQKQQHYGDGNGTVREEMRHESIL